MALKHATKRVDYRVPHGVAVTIGMLVKNEVALRKGILAMDQRDRLIRLAAPRVLPASRARLASAGLEGILDLLRRDKKADGSALKLVVPEAIGRIRIIDLELGTTTVSLLGDCVCAVVDAL